MTEVPNPSNIMALATQYWDAQALLTANRIGVFEQLAQEPTDAAGLAARLGTHERPTRLLLNACVALGLLAKQGGHYHNTPSSAAFLVPGRPGFLGDAIRYSDNLYGTWGQLEQALRSDQPQMPEATYLGRDEAQTRAFVHGMHERAVGIGQALVEIVDLTGRTRMLDVGGGPGTYSALFAKKTPGLRSIVLDLPDIVRIADELLAEQQIGDRVETLPGDYRKTDFPKERDVVLISGVLHRENPAGCRDLIQRASEALEPGGLLVISDVFADAGGAGPAFATLFGLNMMLTAPDGCVHADADVAAWMGEAGIENAEISQFPLPMPHRVVSGRKSG